MPIPAASASALPKSTQRDTVRGVLGAVQTVTATPMRPATAANTPNAFRSDGLSFRLSFIGCPLDELCLTPLWSDAPTVSSASRCVSVYRKYPLRSLIAAAFEAVLGGPPTGRPAVGMSLRLMSDCPRNTQCARFGKAPPRSVV